MRKIICAAFVGMAMAACSSIDCPLNNTVVTSYRLMGDVAKLADTLSVFTTPVSGQDTVVLNRATAIDSFILPISYAQPEDILFFQITDARKRVFLDTVRIQKENHPHFEAVDCQPAVFHKLNRVTTTHNAIDSIVINNENVNYDATKAHFHIYFKSSID